MRVRMRVVIVITIVGRPVGPCAVLACPAPSHPLPSVVVVVIIHACICGIRCDTKTASDRKLGDCVLGSQHRGEAWAKEEDTAEPEGRAARVLVVEVPAVLRFTNHQATKAYTLWRIRPYGRQCMGIRP